MAKVRMMKIAFLDRDGTIISDYPDAVWPTIKAPKFLPGAIDALAALRHKGYEIIIVTNQYLIGEGLIAQAQYDTFSASMLQVLATHGIQVLDIFYCPHRRDSGCACLKPKPGMIEAALTRHPRIDLRQSFLAGDSPCDVELAEGIGVRAFSIDFESGRSGVTKVARLSDVVAFV
jgi:D-glycero-D-manno-heptose 1,7-bisphosphate phosphatase